MKRITIVVPLGENSDYTAVDSLDKFNKKINFLVERGLNPSKNRNRGIRKSKTEFVGFINGHSNLAENWDEKVIEFFDKYNEIDIVGGPQLTPKTDGVFGRMCGYALGSIFGAGEVRGRYEINKLLLNANEKHLTSSNLICKKKVFEKVIFDETLWPGEDPKFISDAIKNGFRVAYSPEIIVYNKRRSSLKALVKQIFNYGQMRPKKEKLIETLKSPIFFIPSLFVLYLSIIVTLTAINKMFLIPLFFYLLLALTFSIYESIKNKDYLGIFILPVIFLTIHLSYGLGFLYGLIKKIVIVQVST